MGKVLIAYYSKTGSTLKVGKTIMKKFQDVGLEADLMEFSLINDLTNYDKVILAAPINGMQWVEPAKTFVQQNGDMLREKKVIVVYVSYIIRSGNRFWRKRISKGVETLVKPINPMVIKDFGGVLDGEFPTFARWIFGIPKGTPLDLSDHQEVEKFAKELINKLS